MTINDYKIPREQETFVSMVDRIFENFAKTVEDAKESVAQEVAKEVAKQDEENNKVAKEKEKDQGIHVHIHTSGGKKDNKKDGD